MTTLTCLAPGCDRTFLDAAIRQDHAEAVHTFDDIQSMVNDAVQETFAGDDPNDMYVWVQDIADDWCVFSCESDGERCLFKASYTISDGDVTFGIPFEVTRQTMYIPVAVPDPPPVAGGMPAKMSMPMAMAAKAMKKKKAC